MKASFDPEKIVVVAVVACAVAVALAYVVAAGLFGWVVSTEPSTWGPFGDYFGGLLNPLVAMAALFVLYRATRYQREELEGMRRAFATEQRPWVTAEPTLHAPLQIDRSGDLFIPLGLVIRNVGKTPARNIWCPVDAHIRIVGEAAWDVQKTRCLELRDMYRTAQVGDPAFPGVVLLPGQERLIKVPAGITGDVIRLDTQSFGPMKPIMLIGCVNYRGSTNNDIHQTWFIFEVGEPPLSVVDLSDDSGTPHEHGLRMYEQAEVNRYFVGDYAD